MGDKPTTALQSNFVMIPNGPVNDTRRFGLFEVDLRAGELRRQGTKVKLQEQPFQILARLIETPGEVVSRDELRQRLWPSDTFVDFDHSLNAAVRRLRDALGDSAENPRFVETIARRGYRFLAPISLSANGNGLHEVSAFSAAPGSKSRRWWIALSLVALILIVGGLLVGLTLAPHEARPIRVAQITANPVDDPVRAAAISPDGRYLAFADDNGFYIRQIDTGETHPLQLPEGLWTNSITWFPDSTHIVAALGSANSGSALWQLSPFGGSHKIIDDGRDPAVSPDGKSIAFISGRWGRQRVWLVSSTGEQPREVAGQEGDLFGRVTWSPDGHRIAYTTAKVSYGYGAQGSIVVADISADGKVSSPVQLLTVPGLEAPLEWPRDGHIIYSQEESRPRQVDSNLWSIRTDGQKTKGSPLRLSNDSGSVRFVSASSDGKRIVYVKGVPEPDVYIAELTSSATFQGEPQRLTLDDRLDVPYDWTPDNKDVIFVSDRTGTFDIYKQRLGQIVPDLLVPGKQQAEIVRLTPDGSQLIYTVYPDQGDSNREVPLMRVPLSGGPPREILRADWISNHQCSRPPANVCVYSMATATGLTFYTFDPNSGSKSRIFQINDDLPALFNWSLSPDGTTLAVAKGKMGGEIPQFRLIPMGGAPERILKLKGSAEVSQFDWAADGKGIWASSIGEKENSLLYIDLQGNVRTVWTPQNRHVQWAIPSRDGKSLALHVHSFSANAWMLEKP